MKSNYVNAGSMTTIVRTLFLASGIVILAAGASHAQAVQAAYKTTDVTTAAPATLEPVITFIGAGEEEMSFNMKYDNPSGDRVLVTIMDSNGEILFNQLFTDRKFNKTFRMPVDIGKLNFLVRDVKTHMEKKIAVSSERRYVEEVSVTKIN